MAVATLGRMVVAVDFGRDHPGTLHRIAVVNVGTSRILSLEVVRSLTKEGNRCPRREVLRMETKSYNERLIREFRANKGRVGHLGGFLKDFPVLLLTTTGARSGRPHTTPLMYVIDGGRPVVFASAGGSPKNPAWYHNLHAHPEVGVEMGEESFAAVAVEAQGAERERLWELAVASNPPLGAYPEKLDRRIPLIALERQGV
jgi:deazaflavin-dependent oxidoreductase (nitroreductase family)